MKNVLIVLLGVVIAIIIGYFIFTIGRVNV